MVVRVKRVPFSNHFSYTVTDRETDTIVMAGKVDSLAGTVYGRVAKEIVEKMVALRGNPIAHGKAAAPGVARSKVRFSHHFGGVSVLEVQRFLRLTS